MTKKYFGTDGIRGIANKTLTPDFAFQLGFSIGTYCLKHNYHKQIIIGWDTRQSSSMFACALAASLNSMGVDVDLVGVIPTGGISYLVRSLSYGLGIMISASHNPSEDNGIKLITGQGSKLSDNQEEEIESFLNQNAERADPDKLGISLWKENLLELYEDYLVSLVPEKLEGWKIAIDGAHGAAYKIAPRVLKKLGAEVILIGNGPTGKNINQKVGATYPSKIQELTLQCGATVGVAFDGDADRAVFSDSKGRLLNGDHVMAIWSTYQNQQGKLEPKKIIGTVMSNGGIEKYLAEQGIELYRASVGDRYVSQAIKEYSAKIGGEQSGHIIFPHHSPTGDGLITTLEFLRTLKQSGQNPCDFCDHYQPWPQMMINLKYDPQKNWKENLIIQESLKNAEATLKDQGRISLRASGTQPILRFMIEAENQSLRDECLDKILPILMKEIKGEIYSKVDLTYSLGE